MLGVADLCRHPPPGLQRIIDGLVSDAVAGGLTLVDTADAYAPDASRFGLGELVVRGAVDRLPPAAAPIVMTKGGHTREPDGSWTTNGSYRYLRRACRDSLRRLGRDSLDIYTFHRPDPAVDFAESVDALASIVADGWARGIALSNVSTGQILQAREVLGGSLVAVQNELSLLNPSGLAEVSLCEQLGLTFFAWAPLGGAQAAKRIDQIIPEAARLARTHSCSPQQIALAWLLGINDGVVPVVGVSRPASLHSSIAANGIRLNPEEIALLTRRAGPG